jgi:hypothetical protein
MDKAAATTNSHEADAFSRKAAELVSRHRLDPDRLATPSGDDQLTIRDVIMGRGAYVRARLALLAAIASAHDVRIVFSSTSDGMVAHAAGFRSDVEVVEVMYQSLHQQAAGQMAAIRRATAASTQQFRRSFLFGYADRLGQLLAESRRVVEASPAADEFRRSAAVALRDRVERVDEFAAKSFGRLQTARRPGAAQVHGWAAGAAAADRADVGRARLAGRRALGTG